MIRILGVDPGSLNTGYGVIDMDGNRAVHVAHGTVMVQGEQLSDKLGQIFRELSAVIIEFQPAECAIEKVFMYRNADSALKLGQARGAAITACAERHLPVFEYTANPGKTGHRGQRPCGQATGTIHGQGPVMSDRTTTGRRRRRPGCCLVSRPFPQECIARGRRVSGREEALAVIGFLRGRIIKKQPPGLTLDVQGVGYETGGLHEHVLPAAGHRRGS